MRTTTQTIIGAQWQNQRVRFALATVLLLVSISVTLVIDVCRATAWIQAFGYFAVLIPLLWAVYYAVQVWREPSIVGMGGERRGWLTAITVLIGAWILFVQVDFGYKIAMDEYILSSTSQNLHETREVMVTTRVAQSGDRMYPSETYVDKRPWLYPVLVSVVHDFTGYRVENAFYLNAVLALCLLWGAARMGGEIAGDSGRVLSVLLWVSLPLLAQNATGGGMELLNLCLVQWLIIAAVNYLKSPTRAKEGLLSCLGVLLAYTRYESLLFLCPLLIVICFGWKRCGQILLSGASVFAATLLLPLFWQLKRYAGNEAAWELSGDSTQAYAWSHLVENLPHALNFFFSVDGALANSVLLSAVGTVALCLLLVSGPRERKQWYAQKVVCWILWVFAPFFILQLISVIGFHAGALDRPFVSRYSLPFHLLFVGSILVLYWQASLRWKVVVPYAIGGVFLFLVVYTLPTNARSVFTVQNYSIAEQQWLEQISEGQLVADSLVVDTYTVPWSLRDWVALSPELAESKRDLIQRQTRDGTYRAVYWVERCAFNDGVYVPILDKRDAITDGVQWSLVAERSFRPFTLSRVYQLRFSEAVDLNSAP